MLKFVLNTEEFDLQKYTAKYSGEELAETVLKGFKEAAYKIVLKDSKKLLTKCTKRCQFFFYKNKKKGDLELFLQTVYKLSTYRKDVNVITRI